MDLLTSIEIELSNVFKQINEATPLPSGYEFYNTVDIVNIEDEAVAVEYGQYPLVEIYQDPDETQGSNYGRAYRNNVYFKIVCKVALEDEVENPQFRINQKQNEILSDIKAIISYNLSLNCKAQMVTILRSVRTKNIQGDVFRTGNLVVYLKVEYAQEQTNPNQPCIV